MNIAEFIPPQSIFYPPYLASALLLALLWLRTNHKMSLPAGLVFVFSRKIWASRSSQIDFILCLFNLLILGSLFQAVERYFFQTALKMTIPGIGFHLPALLEALLATLITMIFIDLASYLVHRLMHASPWLWEIHAVHHSAEVLTPLTTYRQHPLEPLLLNGARGFAAGLGLVLFRCLFPQNTPVITVCGLGAGFFIYMFTVNLHHSMVPLRYPGWMRRFLVSPHIHHLHHSNHEEHFHSNYGVVFSVWDRLSGTYCDREVGLGELDFGLNHRIMGQHSLLQSLTHLLVLPAAGLSRSFFFFRRFRSLRRFHPRALLSFALFFLVFVFFAF